MEQGAQDRDAAIRELESARDALQRAMEALDEANEIGVRVQVGELRGDLAEILDAMT